MKIISVFAACFVVIFGFMADKGELPSRYLQHVYDEQANALLGNRFDRDIREVQYGVSTGSSTDESYRQGYEAGKAADLSAIIEKIRAYAIRGESVTLIEMGKSSEDSDTFIRQNSYWRGYLVAAEERLSGTRINLGIGNSGCSSISCDFFIHW